MKEEEYMRVGTTLYKVVNQPCANGGYEKKRVVWNNSTLRQDYGKNYLATVPKYDGFCTVPNHLNYQKEIEGFLNLYEPIEHKPQQGDFSHIQSLMRHIFGEQYELGMDYMQLLYLQPTQKLPIVLLVSEERNTGKSTFLNFLKAVFENNVTFNTNEDFRSQFNSDWAGKLLIVVDEVLLNRREDSERLKNLPSRCSSRRRATIRRCCATPWGTMQRTACPCGSWFRPSALCGSTPPHGMCCRIRLRCAAFRRADIWPFPGPCWRCRACRTCPAPTR